MTNGGCAKYKGNIKKIPKTNNHSVCKKKKLLCLLTGWMDGAFAAIRSTDLDFLFSFTDVAGNSGDVRHLPRAPASCEVVNKEYHK